MFLELEGRYNMLAEIRGETTNEGDGGYVTEQDPITGEITTVATAQLGEPVEIECQIRAIIDGGIRVAGTTETFNIQYDDVEFLRMVYPKRYNDLVTKRSWVTGIKSRATGEYVWENEESDGTPTQFHVQGPTPVVDPFGMHIENYTLLKRMGVQRAE